MGTTSNNFEFHIFYLEIETKSDKPVGKAKSDIWDVRNGTIRLETYHNGQKSICH